MRQSASALAIVPARRDPGFADLALVAPAGTLTLASGLESLPTLRASHDGLGGTLRARLVNGAAGAYQLAWSLDRRATPFVVHTPPTWFAPLLALRPGRSGFLDVNAFTSTGVAERSFALPNDASLAGIALHLQAWCRRGLFGPTRYSFTNVVDLTL